MHCLFFRVLTPGAAASRELVADLFADFQLTIELRFRGDTLLTAEGNGHVARRACRRWHDGMNQDGRNRERQVVNTHSERTVSGTVFFGTCVGLVGLMASAVAAEVTLNPNEFVAEGFQYVEWTAADEYLMGSLDDAFGDFILNEEGQDFTWCDDLSVLIADATLTDVYAQIGGYSDTGALYRFGWPSGASGAAGTEGGGFVDIGGLVVDGYKLYLGNGYAGGGEGNWSGSIDLGGSITIVPSPTPLALIALAGTVIRRRRG